MISAIGIQKGLRKVVGHGHSVEIWDDPWVSGLPNFRPRNVERREDAGLRVVSDLMINRS